MLTYYQFPKEHWRHLRTTNVVESPFTAVRLRTSAEKRFKKVERATAIIWRLLLVAEQRFRKLNAPELCRNVFRGVRYTAGIDVPTIPNIQKAAASRPFTHFLTKPPGSDWFSCDTAADIFQRVRRPRNRGNSKQLGDASLLRSSCNGIRSTRAERRHRDDDRVGPAIATLPSLCTG